MSVVRLIRLVMVAAMFTGISACHYAKPPAAVKPLTLKAKKSSLHPISPAESDDDDDDFDDYGASNTIRHLPLAGTKWEWEGVLRPQGFDGLRDSADYRLEFKSNGWFDLLAGCRRGAGMYESNGERIALTVIKLSHAHCSHESQADEFLTALEAARSYRLSDRKLFVDDKRQTKTLIFHLQP